jgi:hypothetical protein
MFYYFYFFFSDSFEIDSVLLNFTLSNLFINERDTPTNVILFPQFDLC